MHNRVFSADKFNSSHSNRNLPQKKKSFIEKFTVMHPLFQKLTEKKFHKCVQHGHVRNFQNQHYNSSKNIYQPISKIQAPSISGSNKILSKRPKTTNKLNIGWNTCTSNKRPKSINTVIRSRTSEPRINRKLEILSRQEIDQDQELKPSLTISFRKKKQILSQNLQTFD